MMKTSRRFLTVRRNCSHQEHVRGNARKKLISIKKIREIADAFCFYGSVSAIEPKNYHQFYVK